MPRFAALPDIMKKLKGAIILNLGHAVNAIRFASLEILLLTIKQGLEYPVDCIQKVVALLLDPTGDVIVFSPPRLVPLCLYQQPLSLSVPPARRARHDCRRSLHSRPFHGFPVSTV